MAVDDAGNSRIDFVWGNIPLQPNYDNPEGPTSESGRIGMTAYPGDSVADFYTNPAASYARMQALLDFDNQGFMGIPFNSNQLQAVDNHVIALRNWKNYPDYDSDADAGFALTVDWWDDGQPAYYYPNIIGLPVEEAVKQLIECGVSPDVLVDTQFDNENPYDGVTGNPDMVNAPGANYPGVIIWRYMAPETVIGQHWDGSDWYAWESDGIVMDADAYPGDIAAVDNYTDGPVGMFSYWHSFVVLQTTDENKNSYAWWN